MRATVIRGKKKTGMRWQAGDRLAMLAKVDVDEYTTATTRQVQEVVAVSDDGLLTEVRKVSLQDLYLDDVDE